MKEIYDKIFKGAGLKTYNETNEMFAEFGYAVYEKYLKNEVALGKENFQLKQDLKFISSFLKEKDKEILSKRLVTLLKT